MTRVNSSRLWLALPALIACACGGSKRASHVSAPPNVRGTVLSEAGTPVTGVQVRLADTNVTAVTDANGSYLVTAARAHVGESSAISLSHPDYSPLHGTVTFVTTNTVSDYKLRRHGVVANVVLPATAADAPATVAVPGAAEGDGGAVLRINAGDLTLPNGTPAVGAAVVKMSYWGTGGDFTTAPAPLFGVGGSDANVVGLYSFGMANIEVTQGIDALQVAAGKTLALDFNRPAAVDQNLLTGLDPAEPVGPHLWYADPNTGRWTSAGTLATGATSVDANTLTVRANLPHLSAWNIDGIAKTNQCLTGKVINNCNTNVVGAKYSLWMLTSTGELAVYTIMPDATGTYFVNINGAAVNVNGQQQKTAEFYAWVSGYQQPDQAKCNPTGQSTYSALCTKDVQYSRYPAGSCAGWDTGLRMSPGQYRPIDYKSWVAKCNLALISAPMCGYAPGTLNTTAGGRCQYWEGGKLSGGIPMTQGLCGQLPTFEVPGCGSPPDGGDPCSDKNAKGEGDPCQADIDCCPNASLVCADGLCVPKTDAG